MGKDFFFRQLPDIAFDLGPAFATSHADQYSSYLVSNSSAVRAEVYAPEINFYILNSEDNFEQKKATIQRLYAIRSTLFDACQQTELTVDIGRKVVIISADDQSSLTDELAQHGCTAFVTPPAQVAELTGSAGQFIVSVVSGDDRGLFETDQIVWFDAPPALTRRRGIYDPTGLTTEQTVAMLLAGSGQIVFRNSIQYSSAICQYHQRRNVVCGQCADVCPTGAITRRDAEKCLEFSHVDCNDCGKCVACCPTGAIDYAPIPRAAFHRLAGFYHSSRVLMLAGGIDLKNLQVTLAEHVVPFVLDSPDFLDESHLLTLLESSGYPIMLVTDTLSSSTENSIALINEIFQKKYARPAILLCHDATELAAAMDELSPFPNLSYDLDERSLTKRESFAKRLHHLVGKDDLGDIPTAPHLNYGSITILEEHCTLCLSCADACNTGAITVHNEDNTLRFTAALCTVCGYCQSTCPEKNCLHIERDRLTLSPLSFQEKVMARDEIFKCVECGTGFAPAKAVTKIAAMMEPLFGDDHIRRKALYCCPDCKAKVMLEALQPENILK